MHGNSSVLGSCFHGGHLLLLLISFLNTHATESKCQSANR